MIIIGLTGSIGMGKSTTARMFAEAGLAVNDADAVVHDLYRSEAVEPIGEAFPGSVADGRVDRQELARQLAADPARFKDLEAIVHPLVRQRETEFVKTRKAAGDDMIVLDIPLLFEVGGENRVDVVVVVTCEPRIQRERVLARPGMTVEKFELILARQVPDQVKRQKADFLIDTGQGMEAAGTRVHEIIAALRAGRKSETSHA
jgi:dephospho-CoA kinase